jgi:hypothetical protein
MDIGWAQLRGVVHDEAWTLRTLVPRGYYEVGVGRVEHLEAVERRGGQAAKSRSGWTGQQAYPLLLLGGQLRVVRDIDAAVRHPPSDASTRSRSHRLWTTASGLAPGRHGRGRQRVRRSVVTRVA